MSELLIFVGFSRSDRNNWDLDAQHLDILDHRSDEVMLNGCFSPEGERVPFVWGTEERERALIVKLPDLTLEEIATVLHSADYIVKKTDIQAKELDQNHFVPFIKKDDREGGEQRWRAHSHSFDLSLLPSAKQAIINDCLNNKNPNKSDYWLYSAGVSMNTVLFSKNFIKKDPLLAENLQEDEQYISGAELRQLAGEFEEI